MLQLNCAVAIATVSMALVAVGQGQNISATDYGRLPYDDVIFEEDLMFETKAGSKVTCAKQCALHDDCVTFTFTRGSANERGTCRGHYSRMDTRATMTSIAPASTAYQMGFNMHRSCLDVNFTVIDEDWRDASIQNDGSNPLCDRDTLPAGWYRFLLYGATARIPSTCVERNHCGGHVAMTLNLQGASLPSPGQELVTTSCGGYNSGCCTSDYGSSNLVTVRNCGPFYIYNLVPPSNCYTIYCIEQA